MRREYSVYAHIAPTAYFAPGDYILDNGAGGRDIFPFRTAFRVPPLSLRGFESSDATRADGLTIAWEGDGLAEGYVVIRGWLPTWISPPEATHSEAGGTFTCTERGDRARFTVPPYILETLLPRYVGPFTRLEVGLTLVSFPEKIQMPGLDVTDVVVEAGSSQMTVLTLR